MFKPMQCAILTITIHLMNCTGQLIVIDEAVKWKPVDIATFIILSNAIHLWS